MSDDDDDAASLVEYFRLKLLLYRQQSGLDTATLAQRMEASVPGMLAVPTAALEAFLRGDNEPSDAFINICGRFLARQTDQ